MYGDRLALTVFLVSVFLGAQGTRTSFRPCNCTIQCVRQETPGCEYCRISKEDVQSTLGHASAGLFGGKQTPEICQHYVDAPQNATIKFVDDQNPKYDTVVVSWSPSQYGIAFLQGFQVTLQALGSTQIFCQLFLLQNNLSLSAVHAQRVYYSDPFPHLLLSAQYAATVMALPVPELWDKSHHSKLFFTHTCPEKNGLENCKRDWYPRYIEVHQDSQDIIVTFNLAPENLGISSYFSECFGAGSRSYKSIQPDFNVNSTHHTYRLLYLHTGTNYTCEIAADIEDAVRKRFFVQVQRISKETSVIHKEGPSLAIILSVGILLVVASTAIFIFVVLCQKRLRKKTAKTEIRSDVIKEYFDKHLDLPQCVELSNRIHPPQLLICYSSNDGPAHVRVVLHLATFLQKHMATQVHLDLWDNLSIMEEGAAGWYCRRMKESDFVMVICSSGLNQKQSQQKQQDDPVGNTSLAIIAIIGEEICRANALGQNLSKYMTAIFEYSEESDIPAILNLASNYTLPKDLPLLFSHLHGVALGKPGAYLRVENISENEYSKLPAGAALLLAIQGARVSMTD